LLRTPLRSWTAAALVAAALVLAACGGSSTKSSDSGDGSGGRAPTSIVYGLAAEPANLDFTTTDGAAIPEAMLYNVYEGLVKVDQQGDIKPSLAKSWKVSDDGKTYTFELQPNVKFSNGSAFDAEAVKFSIERVQSDDWKISLKTYMDVVRSVKVNSPTQVEVTLKQPSNNWLFQMTTRIGAMFSPDGVDDLANKPVGTGPYVLDRWVRGDSVRLKANPDYWGEQPAMKQVTLKYFKDATALNNALLSGAIDVIGTVQAPDTLSQFESDDRFQVIEGTTNGELTMALNNGKGPMADKKIRQAVSHAIDRKAVMDAAWAGRGELIGTMDVPTDPWYEDLTSISKYDPEEAKRLLAEAGKPKLTVRFRVPNLPYAVAPAQVVKSQLAKVGITANIDVLEFPARWLDEVFTKKNYDMSIVSHVEPRDIFTFANPDYYWSYDNKKVQDLLASGDAGTPEEQIADTKAAARILAEDAAAYWLYDLPNLIVAKKGIEGLPKNTVAEALDLSTITRSGT
jgi:peptide/nickel transport system substrate-binding protein